MAHIPGLYLKPESFSPSYGRKKMTDTRIAIELRLCCNVAMMLTGVVGAGEKRYH